MEESPRERAISSEPCSGRPNPFDDVAEQTSRKRQRVSRGGSRSRSVDTATDSTIPSGSILRREDPSTPEPDPTPSTPTRIPSEKAEPTSSRVTINLRTKSRLESIPSSPPSPSPNTPSKMERSSEDTGTRISVESESDALSTVHAMETPSSSPSKDGSPPVELVVGDDDADFIDPDPPVAIIGHDDEESIFDDPMSKFPYYAKGENLINTINRFSRFLQDDDISTDEAFTKLRDWIESYLAMNIQIDNFYNSYIKDREFWSALPDLMWALSFRSRFFGEFLRRDRAGRQALTEMLSQFARLAGRFVAMDVRTLAYYVEKSSSDGPILGSRPYLQAFSHLIRKDDGPHIGRNLETHYQWNYDDDVLILFDSFQTEGGTIPVLTELAQGQLRYLSQNPKLVEHLTDPCRIIHQFVSDASTTLENNEVQHQHTVDGAMQKILQGYEFFKIMSDGLNLIIEKHVTFLSPDAAACHLACLPGILRHSIAHDNMISRDFLENLKPELSIIPKKHLAKVVALEWKFGILKKLITSAQMQLRVVGVTTMCSDLLSLHGAHKGSDVTASPVLLYFASLILDNKLVDYLVGIGSHPEIINESSNILGFLIVTRTYKPQLTDTIWQTVMTSQDPRVVDSILRMVQRCMNLCDYHSLIYLCKKVSNVPIEAFTPVMRDFCNQLFADLPRKAFVDGPLLPPPYELCVRLIRESSIVSPDAPSGNHEIQTFAVTKLRELLQNGPGPDARNSIYRSCIKDISDRTPTAAGSICVINALLRQNMIADLRVLTMTHGLTKLLVEELETVIKSDRMSSIQPVKSTPASAARRELLLSIILYEPSTITSELGKRLWDVLVGSESRTVAERSVWWQVLNNAVKKSSSKNVFLAACINEHLPRLPPRCFIPGALDFAREAVLLWLEETRRDLIEEDQNFESHALEQIWHMILTAPPNTIDAPAINILVEVYVESALIQSLPRTRARSIHLGLVDRCLEQLKGAASKLKQYSDGASSGSEESMVIVASEDQFHEQEKIFARSLAVLREFLRAYQQKPQFATPKPRASVTTVSSAVEGEPFTVKYQSFDGDKHTEVKSLTLGKQNTAASLIASLQKATGFKNYKVFCGGKVFDPDEVEVCKSLDDLNLNGLFLVQRRDEADGTPGQYSTNKLTLELEIMKHFDDLWSYLSMHEKVANEIYYFLITFPIYDQLLQSFDTQTSYSVIFPQGQPFKSLYAIHAIREYITSQSQKGTHDDAALARAITLIVAAISDQDVINHCASDDVKNYLALNLIDCLVWLLKQPVLPSSIAQILDETLLKRLLQLLHSAKSMTTSQNSVHLTGRSFEALLETSVHNIELWKKLVLHLRSSPILLELILEDSRPLIRKSIVKQIANKCNSFTPSLAPVSSTNFVVEFWPMIASLIPQVVRRPHQCEELLSIALTMFKRLSDSSLDFLRLGDLVKQWGGLLLVHSTKESVGLPDSVDVVAQGLANLLFYAASFAKAAQQTLACSTIGTELFRKHLFPDLSVDDDEDDELIEPKIPLLNQLTRRTMAETVFLLVKDDEVQYNTLLSSLAALVPYDLDSQEGTPYSYDLGFQFERSKSIRSLTGYVGLKNLSNTCYLNSLFTQLFMNIPFRQFMLEAHVADGGASQKLLSETQNLFSYMQNSLRRYVDPTNLAGSIRTYDEAQIDVTIQMDVDEFYNLLFDRWESQILAPDAKRAFRSFYGGQLVQQVRSKECSHISERLEPFSAIQCDIKGKSSLQESLQAYVDGEVMEGDNKYKCSTCDRHVDAVKRACLKDIPDNLIFHLKRFDFNLRTLQRSKINDHFSFPNKIDMKPYKVEHLMDGPEETPEDVFELVGILVHSGTAESGHYYSFIRERPSNGEKDNWIEFNDDCVTPWDPSCMEGSCFGGVDYRSPVDNGNLHYDKTWSAYMLFYQRSSVVNAQKQMLDDSGQLSPVRLPVPLRLSNHIAMENELLMRKYCLYDPSHVTFVEAMLMNIKNINGGHCSASHSLEKLALTTSLNHLDQVVARTKDVPHFSKFMLGLGQLCRSCAECSRDYLEWFCDYPETLRQLLLRNPDAQVRNDIAASIITALNKVKSDAPYAYGIGYNDESDDDVDGGPPDLFLRLLKALEGLWEIFHTNTRAWPEYFGLLASIAKMGKRESVSLLTSGFLRKTLEVVSADTLLPISNQYSRMLNIISKRITTRPVSYDGVISLLCRLIQTCDSSQESVTDMDDRMEMLDNEEAIPFTTTERHLLMQHWTRNNAHILTEKLYMIHQNFDATDAILVELLQWTTDSLDGIIFHAIIHGIRRGLPSVSCGPFLHAATIYCEHSRNPNALVDIISDVSKIVQELDNTEGRAFYDFFRHIYALPEATQTASVDEIHVFLFGQVSVWAPGLLTYYEAGVRLDTERFIEQYMTSPFAVYDDEDPDSEKAKVLRESIQRLAFACLNFLQETYIRNRQTAVRATVHNIQRVIEDCSSAFQGLDFEPEDRDALPRRFAELRHTVLASLKKYIVEEADEEVSDWDGSEEYDGSSEPMDGIGNVDNDELQL